MTAKSSIVSVFFHLFFMYVCMYVRVTETGSRRCWFEAPINKHRQSEVRCRL